MPDTFQIYQSELTGPELDEALQNIALVQQSVADAAQSAAAAGGSAADAAQAAQTAETYGAIVQQNQPAIQDIAENLDAVQGAAQNALSAQSAAASAAASAQEAEQWAEQAQQVAQGAMGWYADAQALQSAHPTGQNGQWAIVGATDTIWIWDSDTSAWVDSGANMDLSQYYTKTEADARFLGAGDETVVRFVEISIDEETGAVTFTDPQFDFAFLAGCIRHDGETCVVRVKGVAATYSPNEWSEAEDGAITLSFRDHGYIGDSSGRRVYRAPTLEITQRGGAVTGRRVIYIYNTLPSVDASDDGKTLRVVDGEWQVMTPPAYSKVQKIWENPSPTAEYAAQTISVPGLADYDMIIIFTNANGFLPYAYNPPTMAPAFGGNDISVTSYQGTFTRGFTVNFAAQTIAIGDAYTAGIDNRYLVPALIFGIKF